ncbi:hypothetical protein K450DRAFT_232917 [Umbelopsis ramanniana AG]|uniref:Uncharacterized protein n=1 Tax=Umbelopsis ramanniana AG TaxID=1314678 RepID=A0AAD5EDX4_UMBRA|nr:uncharacterized protein K450DRAFT_232917 [Umbelopsis ramanniana AG]KAI8581404.1 hypothetical protein K450DRAFT_232917 [Umbelopsis ramanniana AG]
MTDFTLVAPEPLRFSNSQPESLHYAVTCSLGDDDQSYTSSSWSVLSDFEEPAGSNDSSETSAYTEFQEIINSSRCAHRDSYQGNLGLITKLVQTLREHVPASPVPRSHNPLPNNATFATLAAAHSKRASSCTPSVLTSALEGYPVGKAF